MKKRIYIILSSCFSLLICGCEKFVDVPLPETETVRGVVFSGKSTANAALVSIYSQIEVSSLLADITLVSGLQCDEYVNYSTSNDALQFYNNNVLPDNNTVLSIWTKSYSYIYQCNSVLEGLANSSLDKAFSNQLKGEALFIRAYLYFNLINLYGDVPLTISTDLQANTRIARTSVDSVYKTIITDLEEARSLVGENYLGTDGTGTSELRFRANKGAVSAFLAKVYLYNKQFEKAEINATYVIDNPIYKLDTTLVQTFTIASKEAIVQVPDDARYATMDGYNFVLTTSPSNVAVNSKLEFLSDSTDRRVKNWIGKIVVEPDTFYFPNKYKEAYASSINEALVLFRLSDPIMIRSEARLHDGNINGSVDDLNIVRKRAGIGEYTYINDALLLNEIISQRQIEFYSENGNRWFDLKRLNIIDNVMSLVAPQKGTSWSSDKALLPIPVSEIQKNNLLIQNTGY